MEDAWTGGVTPAPAATGEVAQASGLYLEAHSGDELRLDVDGPQPQGLASGDIRGLRSRRLHWVARLQPRGPSSWAGPIVFRDVAGGLPGCTDVRIDVDPGTAAGEAPRATLRFTGDGVPAQHRTYRRASRCFRPLEIEFDATADAHPCLEIGTRAHPDCPADLPDERLSVAAVFERAGFDVQLAQPGPLVPVQPLAGDDGAWSNAELHDAMQQYWSRRTARPRWALWVLNCARHEDGEGHLGEMFDDIGPLQRQGCAVFTESAVACPPSRDPHPAEWVARKRFFITCHEIGHTFNLPHCDMATSGPPWLPRHDEPQARSFMNEPELVDGGQRAFFADFRYTFSDQALQFMRHAPSEDVQMGHVASFERAQALVACPPRVAALALHLRLRRRPRVLQYLEPCVLELKLRNVSAVPVPVPVDVLRDMGRISLAVQRERDPPRLWRPYSRPCATASTQLLQPGQAIHAAVFAGAGASRWFVSEPGRYRIVAALQLEDGTRLSSPPLGLRVAAPGSRREERLAQDWFSDGVGRALAFDGTRWAEGANDVLRDVAHRLPGHACAPHAWLALGLPLRRAGKLLEQGDGGARIRSAPARPDEALHLLRRALLERPRQSAISLGHVEYRMHVEALAAWLAGAGEIGPACAALSTGIHTLRERRVSPFVLQQMEDHARALAGRRPRGPWGLTAESGEPSHSVNS